MADINNSGNPLEKDIGHYGFDVHTETRAFRVSANDLRKDGSFPNAQRLDASVEAVARRKNQRRELCYRCSHHIYEHAMSWTTFLMFLFAERIPTHRFHHCSIKSCYCTRFIPQTSIKDLEDELFR